MDPEYILMYIWPHSIKTNNKLIIKLKKFISWKINRSTSSQSLQQNRSKQYQLSGKL